MNWELLSNNVPSVVCLIILIVLKIIQMRIHNKQKKEALENVIDNIVREAPRCPEPAPQAHITQ